MLIRLALAILLIVALSYLYRHFRRLSGAARKQFLVRTLLYGLAGAVLVLFVTGRTHWLMAALAAVLPFASRLFQWGLRLAPLLFQWLGRPSWARGQSQNGHQRPAANSEMSRQEALQLLGLDDNAGQEEIVTAHKRLMQRLHPDRGGSDYLAVKLNQAKQVLLHERA